MKKRKNRLLLVRNKIAVYSLIVFTGNFLRCHSIPTYPQLVEDLYIFGQRAGLVGAREIHSIRAAVASVTANVEDATGLANGVAFYVICALEYLFQLSLNKPLKNLVINTGLQRRRRKTSRCYNMVRKFLILEVHQLKHQLQPWKKPKSICMFKSTISRHHA